MSLSETFGTELSQTAPRRKVEASSTDAPFARPARVAAVVVTHNRLDQLRLTAGRLLSEPLDHLVVVDNASTDGTGLWLETVTDPRLHVLKTGRNVGGAGGFQAGLAEATGRFDPDWCVVMDDDARPEPGMIQRFREEAGGFGESGWQAIAAGVRYPNGRICEMNRPSRNPFWHWRQFVRTALGGGRSGFHLRDDDYGAAEVRQIDATSFVGLFLSREAIARAGLPDGRLFLYGDDVIYTLRLTRAGGRIGFAPWLRFEHDCSTFGNDARSGTRLYRPLWKVYYNYRNGLIGYRLAAGPVFFWLVLALMASKWYLLSRAYGEQAGRFRALLTLAIGDAIAGRCDRTHAEIVNFAAGLG